MAEITPPAKESPATITVTTALAMSYKGEFEIWAQQRRAIEEEWIENIRAFNGQYPPDVKQRLDADPNRSKVFVKLARVKVLAAFSRLLTGLFPANDKAWAIEPTPVPDMGMNILPAEPPQPAAPPLPAPGNGNGMPPPQPVIDPAKAARDAAVAPAKAMELEIDDQLMDADWEPKIVRALMELCVTGSMVIKGPLIRNDMACCWSKMDNGQWDYKQKMSGQVKPSVDYESVFKVYPDPLAHQTKEATAVYIRHVMTREQVLDLRGQPGFRDEEINAALANYPRGNWVARWFEQTLPGVTTSGASQQGNYLGVRFEVLERWGAVTGQDLQNAGETVPEGKLIEEFQGNIWVIGSYCIKTSINPSKPKIVPLYIVPYEVVDYRIWGRGIPAMMNDSLAMLNAATRAMLDNMAMASGPQIEVVEDLLMPGQDSSAIHPWKIWRTKMNNTQHPAIRVWKVDSIVQELQMMAEAFRKLIDEETNLPSYTTGQQTEFMNDTASGMSMLVGMMDKITRTVIKNIDIYLLYPFISAMYHWNMQYNPKPEIKGDMNIRARGASVLMAKEIYVQKILQFLQLTANDRDIVDRAALIVELANALELKSDKIVRSTEAIQALHEQMKQQQDPELAALTKQKLLAEIQKLKSDAILAIAEAEAKEHGSQIAAYKAEIASLTAEHNAALEEGKAIHQNIDTIHKMDAASEERAKAKAISDQLSNATVPAPAPAPVPAPAGAPA